jgi:hypothetical protein
MADDLEQVVKTVADYHHYMAELSWEFAQRHNVEPMHLARWVRYGNHACDSRHLALSCTAIGYGILWDRATNLVDTPEIVV